MKALLKWIDSEIVIYLIIWLFILAEPIFFALGRSQFDPAFMIVDWLRDIPLFILFIINTIWLVPGLLFKKRLVLYIVLVLMLIILTAFAGKLIFEAFQYYVHMPPPDFNHSQLPMPDFNSSSPSPPKPELEPHKPPPGGIDMGFFSQIITGLLIISLNTSIKVTIKWFKDEQVRREKEKGYLKSELTFLQNQVSPHFFMNTLNNIHALIDINRKDAQHVIVKLSKMMRYMLYESSHESSTLQKELEFLESYIDLMKLRIDKSVKVTFLLPTNYKNVTIPPLLLIPFVENAFKHGVSYQENSYINMRILQADNLLTLECTNSKVTKNISTVKNNGIGLTNVKKRLDLLYGNAYKLTINELPNVFYVKLEIPVHED
jgi:hypothetical protein